MYTSRVGPAGPLGVTLPERLSGARRAISAIVFSLMCAVAVAIPAAATAQRQRAAGGFGPLTQPIHSAPSLHPPVVYVTGRAPQSEGDIFTDAENAVYPGPLILDPDGRLVWFDQLSGGQYAYNVQVQSYEGRPVITFWQGHVSGFGVGSDVVLNDHYERVATVRASPGYQTDSHDFQITPDGSALLIARKVARADLRAVGGPRRGFVRDDSVEKIDIATGQLLWQWEASQHVRLAASYAGKPGKLPYDFFHMNSIQQLSNGDLLVSARHTWAVYEVSETTGRIVWTLGGKRSSFKLGSGAAFEWQHDASMQPDGSITVFDNGAGPTATESHSRALRIRLNLKRRRAVLERAYTSDPPLLSLSQGSVQPLAGGRTFVGWGFEPYFTEFGRSGRQLFSAHLPRPMESYRAFRYPWSGQPDSPPAIAVAPSSQGTRVYASWNGATGVSSWRVIGGPTADTLLPVGQFPSAGFETSMWLANALPYFAVQALDGEGQVLSTSSTVQR